MTPSAAGDRTPVVASASDGLGPPDVETVARCPVCGGSRLAAHCAGRDRHMGVTARVYRMSRCRGCRALFLSDRCPEDQVHKFYGAGYAPYAGGAGPAGSEEYPYSELRFGMLIRGLRRAGLERPARRLIERVNRSADRFGAGPLREAVAAAYVPGRPAGLFVDYGCGNAESLESARVAGWETAGVDFTADVIDRVRSAGHRGLLVSDVDSLPADSVGLVRMNHVVEHLYRPEEVLAQLYGKLRAGGVLHLATPSPNGLGSRLFGSYYLGLDVPRHIVLFPPKVLAKLLRRTGFSRVDVYPEPAVKDVVRSIGFYEADRGRFPATRVVGTPYDALYSNVLAWPVAVAGRCGLADRYHVLARK